MFRRRAIKLSFIKEPKEVAKPDLFTNRSMHAEKVDHILIENATRFGKDFVTHTATTVVVAYSAIKVVDTLCKVIVIAARAKAK